MRIVVTGIMGYVGSVLAGHLRRRFPTADLVGYDSGLFAPYLTGASSRPEDMLTDLILADVREITPDVFAGTDAVVHLAAVSNDPMGSRFETVTDEINHRASVRCAMMARDAGVSNFVFASSCSVYGFADGAPRSERHDVNPLTAYARSKLATEESLRKADLGGMTTTCLRFATACGSSDRLRLDLVLNDFVAAALTESRITVLSDGTPWRPLIDVSDMARAIEWAIGRRPDQGGAFLAVNAGSDRWNCRVSELAAAVAGVIGNVEVSINPNAVPDRRSYQVDFSLYESLAPEHQPMIELTSSIEQLRDRLTAMNFADPGFRTGDYIRLQTLERLIGQGWLDPNLRWRTALAA